MCDASGVCKGHGHPGKETAEGEPPGIRLEAAKGKVYELVRGLPAKRCDQAIGHFFRLEDIARDASGFYLSDMAERGDHALFGYASIIDYGKNRFGRERTTIQDRIRVARELEGLPLLRRAHRKKGEIGWSKLREIVKVATAETEAQWLEFAREKTVLEIARAVRGKAKGSKPSKNDLGTPRRFCRIRYDVPIAFKALWDRFMEKRLARLGDGAKPLDVLREVVNKCDHGGEVKNIPDLVFHVNAKGECWFDSDEARIPVPLEDAILLARGGRALRIQDPQEGEYPAIEFGERGSVPLAERDDPTPAAIREAVLKRDGYRCVICGSRKDCRVHHLDSRANGGEARVERMVTLCLIHHSLAHEGFITICIDINGRAYAKDREGRDVSREVPPEELLDDAPEPYGMIAIETPEPEPATRVASPEGDGEEVAEEALGEVEGDAEATRVAPEVLTGQGSPSRREFLRAVHAAQSIERIPSRLERDEWHALSGRLEWSRGRGELVFHPEREAAPPWEPAAPPEREAGLKLEDLIGQDLVRKRLGSLVAAAQTFGKPLPHILFEGPAGLGKSSFARALAEEMGAGIQVILGSSLKDAKEVASLLTGLGRGDILFIDEIHAVDKKLLECFYSALEERSFQRTIHEGARSRCFEVRLEPFTLMGATTEGGALPEPLRTRFSQVVRFEPYSEPELVEIARAYASALSISISPEASRELARRARGTPRILRNFIEATCAHAAARNRPGIDVASVLEAMAVQEIDDAGLDRQERQILRYLLEVGRPIGLRAVAAALRMDARTIERVHEPYLIEKGFVIRTMRGRVATDKARMHLRQLQAA